MLFSAVTLCALDGQPDPKVQRTRALPCVGLAAGLLVYSGQLVKAVTCGTSAGTSVSKVYWAVSYFLINSY